jgi:hypothetical protein
MSRDDFLEIGCAPFMQEENYPKEPRNNKLTKRFEGSNRSLTVAALSNAHSEPRA